VGAWWVGTKIRKNALDIDAHNVLLLLRPYFGVEHPYVDQQLRGDKRCEKA
jgi:hypothetical protein